MYSKRRRAVWLASLSLLGGGLAGCNHPDQSGGNTGATLTSATGTGPVATVTTPANKSLTVTPDQFFAQLQNFVPNGAPPSQSFAPPGQSAGQIVLRQMIMNLLVEGYAQDQGLAPTEAQVNSQYDSFKLAQDARTIKPFEQTLTSIGLTPELFKDLQIRPMLARLNLLTKGVTVSDAEVQAEYDRMKSKQWTKPNRVHIKRIALADAATAKSLYEQIQGGKTFEDLVSQSILKQPPDGDLPQWVSLDDPQPPLADLVRVVSKTDVGKTTPPLAVPDPSGSKMFWLVKVVEKKPKETLAFNDVKELIRTNLLEQKAQGNQAAQQDMQQKLVAYQSQVKIAIPQQQYAPLVDELTHPAPPAAPSPMGGMPLGSPPVKGKAGTAGGPAPAPAGKP